MVNIKVISGGQTGADIGGLRAAKSYSIETGGCAVKGFRTETGTLKELKTVYNLDDDQGFNEVSRTIENVKRGDITIVFADNIESPGTRLTINTCKKLKKPYKVNPAAFVIADLITKMNEILPEDGVFVMNIAGNRESKAPGICARTERVLGASFKMVKFKAREKNEWV